MKGCTVHVSVCARNRIYIVAVLLFLLLLLLLLLAVNFQIQRFTLAINICCGCSHSHGSTGEHVTNINFIQVDFKVCHFRNFLQYNNTPTNSTSMHACETKKYDQHHKIQSIYASNRASVRNNNHLLFILSIFEIGPH